MAKRRRSLSAACSLNDYTTSAPVGTVNALPGRSVSKLLAQTAGATVFYWATAFDSSGNESAPSTSIAATTYSLSNADMTPGLIVPKASISSLSDSGIEGQISSFNGQVVKYTGGAWHYAVTDASNLSGQVTTTQITPGAVTTPLLAANAVTTNILASAAVTTAQLAAGAVTTSKLGVLGETLFPDPQVQDAAWWSSASQVPNVVPGYTSPTGGANAAYGWFIDSTSTQQNSNNVGSPNAWVIYGGTYSGTASYEQVVCPAIKGLTGGTYYEFSASVYNLCVRTINVYVQFFDAGGTVITGAQCGSAAPGSGRHDFKVQLQAPSNCVAYRIYWEADGAGQFSGTAWVGSINVRQAGTGTLIVDGTITASKLVAKSITADYIAAGTLTGDLFNSASSLPSSLTISNTGFSLSTIASSTATGMAAGANRVLMSEFSNGGSIAGWIVNDNTTGNSLNFGANATNGSYQAYINGATATAANQVISICGDYNTAAPNGAGTKLYPFKCQPGEYLAVFCRAGSSNTAHVDLNIAWLDANGLISNGIAETSVATHAGGLAFGAQLGGFITVPPGALAGVLIMRAYSAAAGTMTLNMLTPMVTSASPGQTVLPAYVPGTSSNPAATINANTTLISPGKIQISGANTLTSWIYGGDNTSINGGAVAANTITANKLTVGNRNLNFIDLSFQVLSAGATLSWGAGYCQWTNSSGGTSQVSIAAGSITPGNNNYWYVYWTEGATSLLTTTDPGVANADGHVCLCTWQAGQTRMVANYGGTIINGSQITTGSISAIQLSVNQLSAITANLGTISAGVLVSQNGLCEFDLNNARIIFNNGATMKVSGSGFGTSNQFIDWSGPSMDPSQCSESNAISYLRVDGSAYFGGALSAGILKNAIQTTSIDANASVDTGQFGSNGHSRQVVLSYSYTHYSTMTQNQTGTATGKPSATIVLKNSAGTVLATLNVSGNLNVQDPNSDENGFVRETMSGSITFTDNSGGTSVEYSAAITARTNSTYSGTFATATVSQNVGIVSTES